LQRTRDFQLADHNHGKARVRVLKVNGAADGTHMACEYTVATKLFSPAYGKVFTHEDNSGLVATDTQKNTVYVVAKRTAAASPEQFGIDLARHFLAEYPVLSAVEIEVKQTTWDRAVIDGPPPAPRACTSARRLEASGRRMMRVGALPRTVPPSQTRPPCSAARRRTRRRARRRRLLRRYAARPLLPALTRGADGGGAVRPRRGAPRATRSMPRMQPAAAEHASREPSRAGPTAPQCSDPPPPCGACVRRTPDTLRPPLTRCAPR